MNPYSRHLSKISNPCPCCPPPGPQGSQGVAGYNGINGSQGTTGSQGIQGIQGITGTQGSNGLPGIGERGFDANSSKWRSQASSQFVNIGNFQVIPYDASFVTINHIKINIFDYFGTNMNNWFISLNVNDRISIRNDIQSNIYGIYRVSAPPQIIPQLPNNSPIVDISLSFISGINNNVGPYIINGVNQGPANFYIGYAITGAQGAQGTSGGGGGGGGSDWDVSFNYYFMKKPWSPAYITDSTFTPPISMNKGTFDASSGQYDPVDQRIELNWILPPRKTAGFNFSVSPRQLNDGTINLEAGTYSSKGINDDSYNYLPYHETLHIDVREKNGSTISAWNPINTNNLALSGNPKPNLYAQTQGAYFVAGTGTITGDYGPLSGPPSVPQFIYQNENFLQLGSTQYQFRIYLKNKSKEILPSPDYFGTTNPEWNYLYMPDNSGSFFVFGSFGPATPPQLINISQIDYRRLSITGSNNFPNSSNPYADMSLNTPFPSLDLYNLHVNYGFDLSGSISPLSLQFQTPPIPYQTFNLSYESDDLDDNNSNNWLFNQTIQNFTVDNSVNFAIINNNIIFPGYNYDISGYFMKINSDLSYNVYSTNYPTPNPYPTQLVSPPTRAQVTNNGNYNNFLSGDFFDNQDLSLISGTDASSVPFAYYTGVLSPPLQNVYFFGTTSNYNLSNSNLDYKIRNSRILNEYQNDLGTALISQNLCYLQLSTDSSIPQDLNGTIRIGFTGNDTSTNESNNFFEFTQSESKDGSYLFGSTIVEAYRLRGWYLGFDVSNLLVKNIQLTNYPDICNNNFTPWNIDFSQYFANNTLSTIPLNYKLSIAKHPLTDITLNGFSETHNNPSLTQDFFGLSRPSNNPVVTFNIDGQFVDMNIWWRPSNTLMTGNLRYASSNSSGSGNDVNPYSISWPYQPQPATYTISSGPTTVSLNKTTLTSTYKYSRDRAFTPQFFIDGTHKNNITYPSSVTPNPSTLDISFNGLPLWWDFTTLNTSLPFTYTLHTPGTGEYPTNYASPGYSTTYLHTTAIGDQQLMWCKTGFTAGNYTTNAAENPYINYNGVYFGQTQDYSTKNNTGISKNLSYTQSNDDYYEGGNKTITGTYKWIMISNTRVSATSFGRVVVSGTGGSTSPLKLGDDFLLYIQEIDSFFNVANNSIPSGYAAGRSGWKAVHGYWDQGAAVNLNNADEAGCYRRYTNTGAVAVNFIKYYSPNSNTQVFYRIGIKNSSNIKITNVVISYGTN